jgi:hypothetical protein
VDLLILSVGCVEDDKDVIPIRAAFSNIGFFVNRTGQD